MKLYVRDNEKMTDEYYQMKEYRYDILLELNDKYYQLNFMTPFLLSQSLEDDDFYYMKNLFPVKNVSLSNIIEEVKKNIKHDLGSDLIPEKEVNISEWIQIF
jgi:hypothetical protein